MTGPYSRVYHSIIDDLKFRAVYDDDRRLATWLRLLVAADGSWPASAPIPRRVSRAALAHLVDVGLVDLAPNDRYFVHGLARERADRAQIGREGGLARAHGAAREQGRFVRGTPANAGNAGPANAGPAHQLDETRRDETSTTRANALDERPRRGNGLDEGPLTGRVPCPNYAEHQLSHYFADGRWRCRTCEVPA